MADTTYDLEEARRRISRIFRYLQELHRVKTPPTVTLDRYEWRMPLEVLPHYPSIQRGPHFGNLRSLQRPGEVGSGNFIAKIGRPKETECPPPSVMIAQWLKPGWHEAAREVKTHPKKKIGNTEEAFEDSVDRITALDEWRRLRQQWATAERHVVEALGVFSDLFDLWGRLARESEKFELFIGDGVLVTKGPDGMIKHPVLLQRVHLGFDPATPEFCVRETPDSPMLYTALLRYLGIDGKDIGVLKDLADKQHIHPLGGDTTSQFYRTLVQQLWQDGQYFESEDEVYNPAGSYIYRQPTLFLGRSNQGFAEAIDRYVEALPTMPELPEALLRVSGIETGREATIDDDTRPKTDLLLTKHANPEQELVIHRLEESGAVLVQGPPGTGKSHTIANLIGHLLAEGKSILVTSHTSKALRVVREHVAKPLQSLCVSVFHADEDSAGQLEESITGIVNYVAGTSKRRIQREIDQLAERRTKLQQRHDELGTKLLESMTDEYKLLEVCGDPIAPSLAARKLIEQQGIHDWIPGPIAVDVPLPLDAGELGELYELNEKVTAEDETMLTSTLPDLERLPSPKDFATLFDDINRLERTRIKAASEVWRHDNQTGDSLTELVEALDAATEFISSADDWLLECVDAGSKQGERDAWDGLIKIIEQCGNEIPPKAQLILEYGPKIKVDADLKALLRVCLELIDHLKSTKELKKLSKFLKPEWQQFIEVCKVDEGDPTSLTHFVAIRSLLEVRALREGLLRRWDRQLEDLGGAPNSEELGRKPEKTAQLYAEKIKTALDWAPVQWARCERAFDANGLDWKRLASKAPVQQSSHGHILQIREVSKEVKPIIDARHAFVKFTELNKQRDEWLTYLGDLKKSDGSAAVVKRLRTGIRKSNYEVYSEAWMRLQQAEDRRQLFERRQQLLRKLDSHAPAWATAVAGREGVHGQSALPGNVNKAWLYRNWQQMLDSVSQADLDEIQNELTAVKEQLHESTALFVEKQAWKAQLERTGLRQQQALNGWLGLHKKMGKGTGKQAERLKEESRKTLVACRQAVPVWIMPLSRVVESFDIAQTKFDVVIIDEASQSDVLGLMAFALGKSVAVVGDHEQVSPYAVGHEVQTIQGLIDEMLTDIPNKQLYDGKTSVYDLARQSFGGTIRLLEHFRCVPDIIQFSNHLCYGGEIRALREASASKVEPHLIEVRVPAGQAVNKVNYEEGTYIASLVSAICRFEEYDECTIGVICMVGTEQALYIDSILRRRLTVSEYQKRRLLCGNASQFQGDERDIIFISMVDSPSSRKLAVRRRDDWQKVFNVAASRARDQMWVLHSLNPETDLKPDDLRLKLISHAIDPAGLRKEVIEDQTAFGGFNSEFEELVYKGLMVAKFRTVRQCRVGEYIIDLVVEGERRKRVAVVCDGDRNAPTDELVETMSRQMTLERLGWKFIRLRGSEFFRDPDTILKKLFKRLNEHGIAAIGNEVKEGEQEISGSELMSKVMKRAEQIRRGWRDAAGSAAPARTTKRSKPEDLNDDEPADSGEAKTAA